VHGGMLDDEEGPSHWCQNYDGDGTHL